jgi:hypothetical protein
MKLEKCKKRILSASIVPKVYINRKNPLEGKEFSP